ncbi:hypothetical protein OF83DRAFT_93793 [Amylostereum chailletii]|nr:hypothetical protein OF83DRAFT_93793 [Amylostereum chailletii]
MSSDQPFCQVVLFKATEATTADPSRFKALREEIHELAYVHSRPAIRERAADIDCTLHSRADDLEDGGYWGHAVERPNQFYWILCEWPRVYCFLTPRPTSCDRLSPVAVWKSHERHERIRSSKEMLALAAKFDTLIEERTALVYVNFKRPVRPILESPVTEVVHVDVREDVDYTKVDRETRVVVDMQLARGLKGYRGSTWGYTPENGGEGIYIGGWDSIEVRWPSSLSYR